MGIRSPWRLNTSIYSVRKSPAENSWSTSSHYNLFDLLFSAEDFLTLPMLGFKNWLIEFKWLKKWPDYIFLFFSCFFFFFFSRFLNWPWLEASTPPTTSGGCWLQRLQMAWPVNLIGPEKMTRGVPLSRGPSRTLNCNAAWVSLLSKLECFKFRS